MGLFGKTTCAACGRERAKHERFIDAVDQTFCSPEHALKHVSSMYDLSLAKKRSILVNLINSDQKFCKPFRKGTLTSLNNFGGDWNTCASLVLQIIIADTLISIESKLDSQFAKSERHQTSSPGTGPAKREHARLPPCAQLPLSTRK
jgi:hypothetical protein